MKGRVEELKEILEENENEANKGHYKSLLAMP